MDNNLIAVSTDKEWAHRRHCGRRALAAMRLRTARMLPLADGDRLIRLIAAEARHAQRAQCLARIIERQHAEVTERRGVALVRKMFPQLSESESKEVIKLWKRNELQ